MIENLVDIKPLGTRFIVELVDRGETKTEAGIIVLDDDFKERGIKPRRAFVLATNDETQRDGIYPGDTVLLEHGGWTHNHGMTATDSDGSKRKIWMTDLKFVMGKWK